MAEARKKCRWAAGVEHCRADAEITRGVNYFERKFCFDHQGVKGKAEGDRIMREVNARIDEGVVAPKQPLPAGLVKAAAILREQGKKECFPGKHVDAQEQGTGNREQGRGLSPLTPLEVDEGEPMVYPEDDYIYQRSVAIGRRKYGMLRRAGVPSEVAIDQAFAAVGYWEEG